MHDQRCYTMYVDLSFSSFIARYKSCQRKQFFLSFESFTFYMKIYDFIVNLTRILITSLTQYLKCISYFNVFLDCSSVSSRLKNEDDIFLYILSMFICRCFVHLMFVSHLTSFHLVDVN